MTVPGVDDFLDAVMSAEQKVTVKSITESVLLAYATVLIEREKMGNFSTAFSRDDYNTYKREGDPSSWFIEYYICPWSKVLDLLPEEVLDREKISEGEDAPMRFYEILCRIGSYYDVSPRNVSRNKYVKYSKLHPEEKILNWMTYVNRLSLDGTWTGAVNRVCDAVYVLEHSRKG